MRGKCRVALVLALFTFAIISGCSKSRLSPNHPFFPPDTIPTSPVDSVPNDSVPNEPPPAYNQVAVHHAINSNVGGFYEALPLSYDSTDKSYPLLLFLHGGGELGNGDSSQLPLLLKNSVTRRLHEKTFPLSFTVNGEAFSFIVISPQFKEWPSVSDVHDILEYVTNNYRVDPKRIYLSGLSMGGGATWEYAGSQYGKSIAAIVPICGASWADSTVAKRIAANDVPGWAFHNIYDGSVTVNSTRRYVNIINAQKPVHPARMTLWDVGGHDAWTLASDPEYREEGKNMYEWMLQYTR